MIIKFDRETPVSKQCALMLEKLYADLYESKIVSKDIYVFRKYLEENMPCVVTITEDIEFPGIPLITSIEVDDQDYLMFVLKHVSK
jgi:hypothetical protein